MKAEAFFSVTYSWRSQRPLLLHAQSSIDIIVIMFISQNQRLSAAEFATNPPIFRTPAAIVNVLLMYPPACSRLSQSAFVRSRSGTPGGGQGCSTGLTACLEQVLRAVGERNMTG